MDIEQIALTLRDSVRKLPDRYDNNLKEIKNLEDERNDLLHLIELVDLNAVEGFKIYKELQRVQQRRRKLKDENEELKHLYPALKGIRDRASQFDTAAKDIQKTKRYLNNRTYRCRNRHDLQEVINGVKK